MSAVLGWLVTALVIAFWIAGRSVAQRTSLFLHNYTIYLLLLSARIRSQHKQKFAQRLRLEGASDPVNLGRRTNEVIPNTAQSLGKDSTLAAWTKLTRAAKREDVEGYTPARLSGSRP